MFRPTEPVKHKNNEEVLTIVKRLIISEKVKITMSEIFTTTIYIYETIIKMGLKAKIRVQCSTMKADKF